MKKLLSILMSVAMIVCFVSCRGIDDNDSGSGSGAKKYFFYSVSGCVIKNATPSGILCDYNCKCDKCGYVDTHTTKHCNASKESDERKMGSFKCPECGKSTDVKVGYYQR